MVHTSFKIRTQTSNLVPRGLPTALLKKFEFYLSRDREDAKEIGENPEIISVFQENTYHILLLVTRS